MAAWLKDYDPEFYPVFTKDPEFSTQAIDVGRSGDRPRKDLVNWKQAKEFLSFYYDETFRYESPFPENVDATDRKEIAKRYLDTLDFADDKDTWWQKVKDIAEDMGYALQPKKYKKNPELYKGSITDVSNVIRIALTGRANSPDIYEISRVLGEERASARVQALLTD